MRQLFITQIGNLQNFKQQQKEAAVDLLLLIMYADGVVDPKETEYIDSLLMDSTWESDVKLEDYLAQIQPKIQVALASNKELERFVDHAKARIGDQQHIHSIYTLCASMANADKNIAPKELSVIKLLMAALA